MDNRRYLTIKERLKQLNGVFPMDDAVIEALPEGSKFVSIEHSHTSAYTITGRIMALNQNGEEQAYFLKVAYEEHGMTMLRGEYESSKMIHGFMNDVLPKPCAFGTYPFEDKVPSPPTCFYLCEFVDMDVTTAPDPAEFTKRLAHLHKVSKSPTGQFGFTVPTCDGQVAHTVDWQDSWAEFYRRLLLHICELDVKTNGAWPEMERATKQIADVVIPRLLGILQKDGRLLKPCIIHGDLWEGNMGINLKTGASILFDVGSYFAHNEMELGHWRCEFTTVFRDKIYIEHYLKNFPAAEPAEEFDDRNRLYSLKGAINYAAGHPGSMLRKTAYNNMCYLCEKYAPIDGIDKYDPTMDPVITGATITPHLADGYI
ncbi:Fructosamine kinase-domain-containing protein [Stachybotrys elegans]|uniref:protein-ribulosamine 3-kinase n=1 Tax=Stachybotrys elegans TaxID=80388 RepID=A0A8K0WPX9_9HYPO|nr:Fructosamine kinase-domain-containing protein [Stachybotrys elegans]